MTRLSLLLSLALCAVAPVASAQTVEMSVIDRDTDRWLPEHAHRGERWVAGTPGHRYGVRLRNRSNRRVLVVLSVDGVNAVSGETASPSQGGYVLGPWQSTRIDGWRKSLDDVAGFVFTDLADSYAARTGRPDNVGVIGIAVFAQARPRPAPPIAAISPEAASPAHSSRADAAKSAASEASLARDAVAQAIGTGHGEREWSPVSHTRFLRASRVPMQVSQLRYDDRDGLLARGVLPRHHWRRHHPPRAFPATFAPDPPRR